MTDGAKSSTVNVKVMAYGVKVQDVLSRLLEALYEDEAACKQFLIEEALKGLGLNMDEVRKSMRQARDRYWEPSEQPSWWASRNQAKPEPVEEVEEPEAEAEEEAEDAQDDSAGSGEDEGSPVEHSEEDAGDPPKRRGRRRSS
jgi:hypothetical protein